MLDNIIKASQKFIHFVETLGRPTQEDSAQAAEEAYMRGLSYCSSLPPRNYEEAALALDI